LPGIHLRVRCSRELPKRNRASLVTGMYTFRFLRCFDLIVEGGGCRLAYSPGPFFHVFCGAAVEVERRSASTGNPAANPWQGRPQSLDSYAVGFSRGVIHEFTRNYSASGLPIWPEPRGTIGRRTHAIWRNWRYQCFLPPLASQRGSGRTPNKSCAVSLFPGTCFAG